MFCLTCMQLMWLCMCVKVGSEQGETTTAHAHHGGSGCCSGHVHADAAHG